MGFLGQGCTVSRSSAVVNVQGSWGVGGLIGSSSIPTGQFSVIEDSFSTGDVSASTSYGAGFFGFADPRTRIFRCYSTGAVTGAGVDGFAGGVGATVEDSFWDTVSSGVPTSTFGIGRSTDDMLALDTFTTAGWDFVNLWNLSPGAYPNFR